MPIKNFPKGVPVFYSRKRLTGIPIGGSLFGIFLVRIYFCVWKKKSFFFWWKEKYFCFVKKKLFVLWKKIIFPKNLNITANPPNCPPLPSIFRKNKGGCSGKFEFFSESYLKFWIPYQICSKVVYRFWIVFLLSFCRIQKVVYRFWIVFLLSFCQIQKVVYRFWIVFLLSFCRIQKSCVPFLDSFFFYF